MLARHTGWSYDFIHRRLPLALGLQIILLNDSREGLTRVWSVPMKEDEADMPQLDISDQIKQALQKADASNSNSEHG